MSVDSFKFLTRLIATFYQMTERVLEEPIPWNPVPQPLEACKFGLVTSGGLFHKGVEPPFDLDRERDEPAWGDPTFRRIPIGVRQEDLGVSHLHINPEPVLSDLNVLLPVQRFQELVEDGRIAAVAEYAYSFMGYQGFPPDASAWRETYGPQVAEGFEKEGVHCVLLTPA